MSNEEHEKWQAQKRADRQKLEEEDRQRRDEAVTRFKAALDEHLTKAYKDGREDAVSTAARKAVDARSYVLWGVVAAVVSMPIIGMLLNLDPQTFGAFIAPVTGIAGTVVGYWFGTVGQVPGQGMTPSSRREDR